MTIIKVENGYILEWSEESKTIVGFNLSMWPDKRKVICASQEEVLQWVREYLNNPKAI